MDINGAFDIQIHGGNCASVKLVHDASAEHENLLFLLWFSAYAVRQIVLLGPESPPALKLIESLHLLAGQKTMEEFVLSDNYVCSLIEKPKEDAVKGFKSEIVIQSSNPNLYRTVIRPYGFSVFGMGINSHAAISVFALLRYYTECKKEDKRFLSSLAFTAEQIGLSFLVESSALSADEERFLVNRIVREGLGYKEG